MNLEAGDGKAAAVALPQFKKFVSEGEVEDTKRKRQEEWERVRKPHQPVEAPPEEPEDRRCLFDRLQEQKDAKQAEHDDKYALKNQVRGLEDEEAQFLDTVYQRQGELLRDREKEEDELLEEYRNSLANQVAVEKPAPVNTSSKPVAVLMPDLKPRTSQSKLLSGAIIRKRKSSACEESDDAKRSKEDAADAVSAASAVANEPIIDYASRVKEPSKGPVIIPRDPKGSGAAGVATVLPGIGLYTDSDESSSSSDSNVNADLAVNPTSKAAACDRQH